LGLVVWAFLSEQPMRAYRMFHLMQQRDEGSIVVIAQRNSLYQAMNRLVKSGLAEVDSTERTDSRITDPGIIDPVTRVETSALSVGDLGRVDCAHAAPST
jgi:hypothetical protein